MGTKDPAAAVAPVRYPTRELPHATDVAKKKKKGIGLPLVAQRLTIQTRIHEVVGSIPGLDQWVKDPMLQTRLGSCVAGALV